MRSDNIYLKAILVLALLGILVSGWLLSTHIRFSSGQAGLTEACTIFSSGPGAQGCASIAVSDYSYVFGVPVAAIAMSFYVSILLLAIWAMRNYQAAYEPLYVGFFLSTVSILVTVLMFYLSRFVLKEFCIGCSMLWLINLAIWPCFVKHLGLGWGNALAANLELVRPRALSLKRERVLSSLGLAVISLVVFGIIGASARGLQAAETAPMGSRPSLISEWESAPQVFLGSEAYGGAQAKGKTDGAPVLEILEFADFQCPACRMAAQYLKPFVLKHKDQVRLTFRNFPLDGSCNPKTPNGPHHSACSAARHAMCAGQQGKFWEMHDLIFDGQEALSPGALSSLVSRVGLDEAAFGKCLADPATETQLQREMQWGEQIGLNSTPTIVINGRKLAGAQSPAELEALLKHIASKK